MTVKRAQKLPANDWFPFFDKAGIKQDELNGCKSERGRAIKLGQFLSPMVGREVLVQVDGRTGKAVLRVELDRAKTKRYYFEVIWDCPSSEQGKPDDVRNKEPDSEPLKKKTGTTRSRRADEPPKKSKTSGKVPEKRHDVGRSDAAPAVGKTAKAQAKTAVTKTKGNNENWD